MRVLLGIPPYDFREFYPEYAAKKLGKGQLIPGATPPLGLLYIAAVLRAAGHDVIFLDGIRAEAEDFVEAIRTKDVGLTCLLMTGFAWARSQDFMRDLKEACPDTPIAVGGPWPDTMQKQCLEENPAVDFAGAGDGEYIVRELVACLENGGNVSDVKGIAWRTDDGMIIVNDRAPLIYELDEVPFPARDLLDINEYAPSIGHYHRLPATTMIGQRGCRHKCIFCHTNTWMRHGERYRSPENVVDEMMYLEKAYGVRDILFWDNNITENYESIRRRCELLIERGSKLIWSGNSRADTLDLDTAKLMKRAGCWKLLIGVESGVQKNLDELKKGETVASIERAIKICKQVGIRVFATFIFGVPGETFEDGLKTIEFAKRLSPDYAKFNTMAAHPGTALHDTMDYYGTCLGDVESQSHHTAGFVPHTMTQVELQTLFHRANRAFYMRPRYWAYKLSTLRSLGDLKQNVRGFRAYSGAIFSELSVG
ncbi:MAG: anaerobic magnesium-protoporphyrin IX monomethyl ester cyclase [Myxococcota bacterium]